MKLSAKARWIFLALAGLLVALAVAVAASTLTSQRIGLASEPLQAGQDLAALPHRLDVLGHRLVQLGVAPAAGQLRDVQRVAFQRGQQCVGGRRNG